MASSVCAVSRTDSRLNIGCHLYFMGPNERIMGKNDKHPKVQTMDIFRQMFYLLCFYISFFCFWTIPLDR